MPDKFLFTNFAVSKLAAPITAGATSLTLATGDGAKFPAPSTNEQFRCTLFDDLNNREVIYCTQRTGDTFNVIVRGQEGTSAQAWATDDGVELILSKETMEGVAQKRDVQRGAITWAGSSTGTGNDYIVTIDPAPSQYTDGMEVWWVPDKTNTGSANANVNSLGLITIYQANGQALHAGAIQQNQVCGIKYYNGNFYLIPPGIKLNVAQEWTAQQNFDGNTLTWADNLTWNLDTHQVARLELTADVTTFGISNAKDGATYILIVDQDATGGWDIGWSTDFWASNKQDFVLSTDASARDILSFVGYGGKLHGNILNNFGTPGG